MFMNKSEKAICGSSDLIQQDLRVGTLSRRAKVLDPHYSKDNRAFRSALKKCDGDLACLSDLYTDRIKTLQDTIDSGRTLSDEEIEEIESRDKKAERKFTSQEHARERYADKALIENEELKASKQNAGEIPNREDDIQVTPPSNQQQIASTSDSQPIAEQAEIAQETNTTTHDAPNNTIKTTISIWNLLPWWAWLGGAILTIGFFSRKKCPRCGKRGTSKEINRTHEGTSTEYRDVDVEDKHRNSRGELIKTVTRTEQRATKVDHYTVYFRCDNCKHKWQESIST